MPGQQTSGSGACRHHRPAFSTGLPPCYGSQSRPLTTVLNPHNQSNQLRVDMCGVCRCLHDAQGWAMLLLGCTRQTIAPG